MGDTCVCESSVTKGKDMFEKKILLMLSLLHAESEKKDKRERQELYHFYRCLTEPNEFISKLAKYVRITTPFCHSLTSNLRYTLLHYIFLTKIYILYNLNTNIIHNYK